MYRRKNARRKKVGRKSADEKLSDENLLDEKMSWNQAYQHGYNLQAFVATSGVARKVIRLVGASRGLVS